MENVNAKIKLKNTIMIILITSIDNSIINMISTVIFITIIITIIIQFLLHPLIIIISIKKIPIIIKKSHLLSECELPNPLSACTESIFSPFLPLSTLMFLLQLPPGECGRLLRSSLPPPGTHLCSCQLAFVRGDDKNMFGHSPDQHLVWSHHCHWAEFWLTSWLESRWIIIKDVFSSFRVFTLTQHNPTQPNSPCDPDIMTKRNHYLICLIDDDSVMTMTMKALEVI